MNQNALRFIPVIFLVTACGKSPATEGSHDQVLAPLPTLTELAPPSPTPGKVFIVTNLQDSGPGTLRQALQNASAETFITFDPVMFPPDNPTTITLLSALPPLDKGQIILDASNAGVSLDGSQTGGDWTRGLDIASNGNVVRGLQITGFSGAAILVRSNAEKNTIGGERTLGQGPFGQGNLLRNCTAGIALRGPDNLIFGNLIGTDVTGQKRWGNTAAGIFLEENANRRDGSKSCDISEIFVS